MRDAFAVLFFVSVGMLFDPGQLMQTPLLLLATLGVVLIGKPMAAFAIVTLMRYGSKIAFGVAVALAQIGEFSLILAALGDMLGVLAPGATNVVVAAAIISITLTPALYRLLKPMEAWLSLSRGWRLLNPRKKTDGAQDGGHSPPGYRAVVVGFGPIGQTVSRLLRDGGLDPVVVETNLDTVRRVRSEGYRAVYGDAAREEVLESAGVRDALALVISGPAADESADIIRAARVMNPNVRVLARSYYLRDTSAMRRAGANEVFSGEGEVALAITEYLLGELGATPEQIDRERQRVRDEVFRHAHMDSKPDSKPD
jgi:CPA2 family monovalent cation:H+ antiporter-2